MDPLSVNALMLCIDVIRTIETSVRRADIEIGGDDLVTFRRDSENNWYLDPDPEA